MKLHLLLLPLVILLVSCGDSRQQLMDDQFKAIDEITSILEDVADGDLSSADAAKEIEKWGEKMEEIQKRKEALGTELSPEEQKELVEAYADRSTASVQKMMTAMRKLQESGRMTQELQDAMVNVK